MKRFSATAAIVTGAVIIAILITAFRASPSSSSGTSVAVTLRVGADHSPPYYSINPDGSVQGLTVDVMNEAARRAGIKLVWVPLPDASVDASLRNRTVDLWPLSGATEERLRSFYVSEPWLASDYVLVSRQQNPIRDAASAAGKTVVHANLRFTNSVARTRLSRSMEMTRGSREQAIQAVCDGKAEAALAERRVLDMILLSRPAGCESTQFHVSTLPGAAVPLSIIAVPEAREAVKALRKQIQILRSNGFLAASLDEWSPFLAQSTREGWAKQEADRRSTIYKYCLVVIVLLGLAMVWLTARAWRLKREAEASDAGLREAQRRFAAFMDNSPATAFMKDAAGRLLYVNRAWSQTMNRDGATAIGKSDFDLWPARVAQEVREIDLNMLAENKSVQVTERIPVSQLDVRDFLVIKFPFANDKGERFIGGTAIDITEREVAIRKLAESEARHRELFQQNPLPAWVCDRETLSFLNVNDAAVGHYGWTRQDFMSGMTFRDILAPNGNTEAFAGIGCHQTKDGHRLTVDVTAFELEYEGRAARLMMVRDLTEQESTLEQLRVSEQRWQLALRGAGDALWDWDLTTDEVFRSARWRAMLGYEESEIGNSPADFRNLVHPDDCDKVFAALRSHLDLKSDVFAAEYRMRHKDGKWRWIMDRGQAIWDERGKPVRIAGSHTDITARKKAEAILTREAKTDALTGLTNRREFQRLFGEVVRTARECGKSLTVAVCDLDGFKQVNDKYGHPAGDRVLISFGEILREQLRKGDLFARLGGDEFVVALPGTTLQEALETMERIRLSLNSHVFNTAEGAFLVSSSFGLAELRDSHETGDALIAEADRHLYAAKQGGRNRTFLQAADYFNPALPRVSIN